MLISDWLHVPLHVHLVDHSIAGEVVISTKLPGTTSGTTNLQYFLGLEVERQVQYEQARIVKIAYSSNLT